MTGGAQRSRFAARPVQQPRAHVEAQIREAILLGDFAQGEKLPPETELADQFGVSRPTVREALGSLVGAGLIRKVTGVAGGSFVTTVTPDSVGTRIGESMTTVVRLGALDAAELAEVRRLLEVPAARSAAENRTARHLDQLWSIVDRGRATTIDHPDVPSCGREFHSTIGLASGNRLLATFVRALHVATHPVRFRPPTPSAARRKVRQHIDIVTAIEAGRPDDAARAMDEHLAYVLRFSAELSEDAAS